jgi:Tfp pilus assembly protein PilN
MSVKVNLLPREIDEKNRRTRQFAAVGAGFALLLVALAGVWFWQGTRIDDAEVALAAEEAVLAELTGEQAELAEFAELEIRRDAAQTVLASTLGDDASLAGVMQDLAAVLPTDVELETMTLTLPDEPVVSLGDVTPALGTLSITGITRDGHAPGLERILLELGKLTTFSDVFFSNSTLEVDEVDESADSTTTTAAVDDVVRFSLEVDLGSQILTGRYSDGIPEVLR